MWAIKATTNPLTPAAKAACVSAEMFVPLNTIQSHQLEDLFRYASVQTCHEGDVIFNANDEENIYVFLQSGTVELQYPSGHIESICSNDNTAPLSHQFPRPCRAVAVTDITIFCFDSSRIDKTLCWSQISDYLLTDLSSKTDLNEEVDWMQTVLSSNLFFKIPPVNAYNIFAQLNPVVVKAGDVVISQGDVGDCCYFIKEGYADIYINNSNDSLAPYKAAEISSGRCFGEDALLDNSPRNASVIMTTDGLLMRLELDDFLTLLQEPQVDELSETEMGEMIEAPILIDVRTDDEYRKNHLAFSANLPLNRLITTKCEMSPEQPYVFYCDTGGRSRAAAFLLGKEGYNTYALKNGFIGQNMSKNLVEDIGYVLINGELSPK